MTHHPMAHGFPQVVKDTSLCSLLLQAPTQTPVPLKQNRAISHPLSSTRNRDKALSVKKNKNLCQTIDTEEKVGSTLERMAQETTS